MSSPAVLLPDAARQRPVQITFVFRPETVTRTLLVLAGAVIVAGVATQYGLKYGLGYDNLLGIVPLFNLGMEQNIPTWFSTVLLLLCSCLLGITAFAQRRRADRFATDWAALSLVFLLLSVDEAASIHEMANGFGRQLRGSSWFHYGWVIPGLVTVAALALSFTRFLLHLPGATAVWFVAAGAVYVGGALGMEMVAGYIFENHPDARRTLTAMVTIEESCEMLGLVLFVSALLAYLQSHLPHVVVGPAVRSDTAPRGLQPHQQMPS